MRSWLVLCLLLILPASSARAGGLNLAWDQCWPEGGVAAKKFACGVNTGYSDIVGSFVPNQPHGRFVAFEVKLDLQSESTNLPDWWQFFNSGTCRENAFTVSFDFTTSPQSSCTDPFEGVAMGGIGYYATMGFPRPGYSPRLNAGQIGMAVAMANARFLSSGTEYYAFRLRMLNRSSAGGGACAGCATPVCLTLSEVLVYDEVPEPREGEQAYAPPPERISQQSLNNMIGWQDTGTSCQSAVKNKTWGQLKSLYR